MLQTVYDRPDLTVEPYPTEGAAPADGLRPIDGRVADHGERPVPVGEVGDPEQASRGWEADLQSEMGDRLRLMRETRFGLDLLVVDAPRLICLAVPQIGYCQRPHAPFDTRQVCSRVAGVFVERPRRLKARLDLLTQKRAPSPALSTGPHRAAPHRRAGAQQYLGLLAPVDPAAGEDRHMQLLLELRDCSQREREDGRSVETAVDRSSVRTRERAARRADRDRLRSGLGGRDEDRHRRPQGQMGDDRKFAGARRHHRCRLGRIDLA